MPYCFILSNRQQFRKKLKDIILNETLYEPIVITLHPEQKKEEVTEQTNYENPVALFRAVEHKITNCPAERLRSSVVVVDELISPKYLDPLTTLPGPHQFFAMLMLAFPELQFTFLNTCGLPNPKFHLFDWLDAMRYANREAQLSTKNEEEWIKAIKVSCYPDCQLFDPHGMRETIKNNILNHHKGSAPYFPEREHLALSLEDESSYALFHAYAAFKTGHKCKVVDSFAHLKSLEDEVNMNRNCVDNLKGEGEEKKSNGFKIKLQFEDQYLSFYDMGDTVGLSDIKKRHKKYQILGQAENKNLITVGHNSGEKEDKINKEYIKIKKINKIIKPGKGLYDLLKEASLLDEYKEKRDDVFKKNIPKNEKKPNSHSAPGQLVLIAESLLKRASLILGSTQNVAHAIHAATLAMEAKELLGSRTPTAALQALALQHQAEITAESLFYGVEYEMVLKPRFEDIKKETEAISKWFSQNSQEKQQLNAYLNIVEHLAKEFKQWKQFDEELTCLIEARKVRHNLRLLKLSPSFFTTPFMKFLDNLLNHFIKVKNNTGKWFEKIGGFFKGIFAYPMWLVYRYVEKCLSSLTFFGTSIFTWILLFAFFYWLLLKPCIGAYIGMDWTCFTINESLHFAEAFVISIASFFTMDPSPDWVDGRLNENWQFTLLVAIHSAIAFLHLSLLVSYVYLRISRR